MIPLDLALEEPAAESCDLVALGYPGVDGQGIYASGPASALWSLAIPSTHEVSAYSTWTVSLYAGADVVFEKDNAGAATKYVYADGMRLAKITPSEAVQYYLADHEGSTRQVRDANRNLVFSAEYEPFGKPYAVTGSEAYTYTSERHDDPTGLVYLRARQYDPDLGRFTSADPVLGSLSAPQTQNRFTYVANNPLTYTDPSGMYDCGYLSSGDPAHPSLCEQAWRWHGYWDALGEDPWFQLDLTMTIVGFVPFVDTISDVYFVGRDLYDCFTGSCDAPQLVFDAGMAALPIVSVGMAKLPRLLGRFSDAATAASRAAETARLTNRVEDMLPSGGIHESILRRLRMSGVPNSIVRQVDGAGNLRSLGFYDEFGRMSRRIDVRGRPHFIPGHGYALPHVTEFVWSPGGSFEGWGFRVLRPRIPTIWEEYLIRVYR